MTYMLTRVIKEACGFMKKDNQSLNILIKLINQIRNQIIQHENYSNYLDKKLKVHFGKKLALRKYIDIRFLSVIQVLERALKLWDVLEEIYQSKIQTPFPLNGYKEIVEELVALFQDIKVIQKKNQEPNSTIHYTILKEILQLYENVLQDDNNLKVKRNNQEYLVESKDLSSITKTTRQFLREGLKERFIDRYSSNLSKRSCGKPASSLVLEAASLMYPGFKSLSILKKYPHIHQKIHQVVLDLAKECCRKTPVDKVTHQLNFCNIDDSDNKSVDSTADLDEEVDQNTDPQFLKEWNRYKNEKVENYWKKQKNQNHVLDWWRMRIGDFPLLCQVARCLLGSLVSSATVELDNGVTGLYVPKKRVSLSVQMVEMKVFIKRNESFLN